MRPEFMRTEENALIVRTALALPVICALTLFIYFRSERKAVHLMMAALIASIIPWLLGMVIRTSASSERLREMGLDLEHITGFWMPALFAASMGYFARLRTFETNLGPAGACLVSAPLFSLLYMLDAIQPLYFADRAAALAGGGPESWAGPLYWASKAWAVFLNGAAFTFLGLAVFRGRTIHERRRATALVAAAGAPAAAHFAFVAGGGPVLESLTPLALVVTAAAVIHGAHRHGLLDGPPLIRTDILDHLREGMIVTNEAGIVVDVNEPALATLGTERDLSLGSALIDLLALPLSWEKAKEIGERVMALSPEDGELTLELAGFDGAYFELSAGALRSQTFLPAGRIVLLRDRSEQRRAERMLQEHQKRESVGILAAGVAHEVNNPLAYVRANLSHIEDFATRAIEAKDSFEGDDWLELPDVVSDTIEGLDRIEQIVKNLVRFSGTPEETFERVEINDVASDALRLANLHRGGEVRIERSLGEDLPAVQGSANRMVQAILNLVLNARQALADTQNPWISIQAVVEQKNVVIRVSDNGPGVSDENRYRIFDPFFTTRGPDEGTGLGLSIGFDIAREHGGVLELEAPEQGASFALRLPISTEAATRPQGEG